MTMDNSNLPWVNVHLRDHVRFTKFVLTIYTPSQFHGMVCHYRKVLPDDFQPNNALDMLNHVNELGSKLDFDNSKFEVTLSELTFSDFVVTSSQILNNWTNKELKALRK